MKCHPVWHTVSWILRSFLRSPNGRRRIAFVTAPPQATSSSGQLPPNAKPVWISSNEKASESSSSLPNVTTEQKQPLALGKKHLEETTPKDPDQQVTPIKVVPTFPFKKPGSNFRVQQPFSYLTSICNPLLTETVNFYNTLRHTT